MNNDSSNEHEIITSEELSQMDVRFKKIEEEGLKNTLKHFDRIHDKLVTFNNILIAGYFTLSKLDKSISALSILIPIANLCFLIFLEYRMMEKSRFESYITKKPITEISKYGKSIDRTNLYSLFTIVTTSIVTLIFLYHLV